MAEEDERLGRRRGGQPAAGEELHAPRAPHVLLLRSDPIHGGPRADSQTRSKRKSARKSPGENEKNKEIDEQAAGRPATAMRGAGSS